MSESDSDRHFVPSASSQSHSTIGSIRVQEWKVAQPVRLDISVARSVEHASRTKAQALIEAGWVDIDGVVHTKPGRIVREGETVRCRIPRSAPPDIVAEDIPLDIVYEDDAVLVVNKPSGMVTHPAYANYQGTLVNALLHHCDVLSSGSGSDRAGIVHRLDKDTSGLLCVAKTDAAHTALAAQFADHSIHREYQALIWGTMPERRGRIDAPIGRSNTDRKKMAVSDTGKNAITEYETLESWGSLSLVRLRLHTGRTHQIRVHLSTQHHPVFGDPTYGGRRIHYGPSTGTFKHFIEELLRILPRQALHARTLGFRHPVSGEWIDCASTLPDDMQTALRRVREYFAFEIETPRS